MRPGRRFWDNRELLLVGNHLRGVAPRIPVVPVIPLSVVPDVRTALDCCGYGRGLFSFVSHVCLSFKNGGQGSNIGFSPPLGLHEDSQPLAASPWLDNSVIENTLKKKGWQGRRIW